MASATSRPCSATRASPPSTRPMARRPVTSGSPHRRGTSWPWTRPGIRTSCPKARAECSKTRKRISLRRSPRASARKLVLLSHHQLMSVYDQADLGPVLPAKLGPVLDSGRVTGWWWGHEHRCMGFEAGHGVRFPRCIGHGGVPVLQTYTAGAPIAPPGSGRSQASWRTRTVTTGPVSGSPSWTWTAARCRSATGMTRAPRPGARSLSSSASPSGDGLGTTPLGHESSVPARADYQSLALQDPQGFDDRRGGHTMVLR